MEQKQSITSALHLDCVTQYVRAKLKRKLEGGGRKTRLRITNPQIRHVIQLNT